MKPAILIIGGAGYIGSNMVQTLLHSQYQPVVFDNLCTGHRKMVPAGVIFIEGDLQEPGDIEEAFKQHSFSGVMHFAASNVVPESVREPLKYYRNNVSAFLNLLEAMKSHNVKRLIFSSTAAVYGESGRMPIKENFPTQPLNPYGQSKWMMEKILEDVSLADPFSYVIFRYFNVAGAHASSEIGESHDPETHLIPNLISTAGGESEFSIFGVNYPTRDGTCVRDYIHVEDLCQAHLQALNYLELGGKNEIFNLGSERGYTVKEVLSMVERITGEKIPVKIADKRAGDPPELIADSRKARRILNWIPKENLETIILSAYRWYKKGFQKSAESGNKFAWASAGDRNV